MAADEKNDAFAFDFDEKIDGDDPFDFGADTGFDSPAKDGTKASGSTDDFGIGGGDYGKADAAGSDANTGNEDDFGFGNEDAAGGSANADNEDDFGFGNEDAAGANANTGNEDDFAFGEEGGTEIIGDAENGTDEFDFDKEDAGADQKEEDYGVSQTTEVTVQAVSATQDTAATVLPPSTTSMLPPPSASTASLPPPTISMLPPPSASMASLPPPTTSMLSLPPSANTATVMAPPPPPTTSTAVPAPPNVTAAAPPPTNPSAFRSYAPVTGGTMHDDAVNRLANMAQMLGSSALRGLPVEITEQFEAGNGKTVTYRVVTRKLP